MPTIRFLNAKDGYAKGALVSTLAAAVAAAYVASADAVYDSPAPSSVVALRRVLGQQGIPCILPCSATVATNGTLTLGTALPLTYPKAWVYLPAGAVVGGLAGWYYAVFSSTTVGQIYTAYQATMGKPYIPPTLTAAVGSNAGYTTGTGADVVLGSVTVPANLLGTEGAVDLHFLVHFTNSANNKTVKATFGGSTVVSTTATTTAGLTGRKRVQNRATNAQVIQAAFETGAAVATAPSLLAIDTTADVAVAVTGNLANVADNIVLESFSVELLPTP